MDDPTAWMSPDPRREVARAEPQEAAGCVGGVETGDSSNEAQFAETDEFLDIDTILECARRATQMHLIGFTENDKRFYTMAQPWVYSLGVALKDCEGRLTQLEREWPLCDDAHSPIRYPDPDGDDGCPLCMAICDGHEEVVVLRARLDEATQQLKTQKDHRRALEERITRQRAENRTAVQQRDYADERVVSLRRMWNEANTEKDAWKAKATELEAENALRIEESRTWADAAVLYAKSYDKLKDFAECHPTASVADALRAVNAGWPEVQTK